MSLVAKTLGCLHKLAHEAIRGYVACTVYNKPRSQTLATVDPKKKFSTVNVSMRVHAQMGDVSRKR